MAAASTATDGEPQGEAIPMPITPEPLASNAPVAANAQTPATLATDAAAQSITGSLVAKVAAPTTIVSGEAAPTAPVGPEATADQTAATDANLDQMVAKTLSTKTEEASATKPKAKTERASAKTDPAADLLATIAASKDPAAAEPAAGTKAAEPDARPTGDQAKQNRDDAQGQTSQSSQNPAALPVAPAAVGDFAKTAAAPVQAAPVAGKVSDVAKTETLDSAQSAMPAAKTFANDAGLAPNALLSPAPTTVAEAAKFSAPTTLVRVPMTELGATVVRMAKSGENAFDLRLDPLDLGRVDVKVEIADNGRINATFLVERKETLEMLQRDQSQLQKAFDMAGLKTDAGSLSFSLKDQNNPGNQGTPREFRAFGRYDQSPDSADLAANDAPIISRPTSALRALDISV